MHPHLIQQLDEAVAEVFSLMLNRECHPGICSLAAQPLPASADQLRTAYTGTPASLSAHISFSGSMRGACSVHLALRTAAILTGELLGEPPEPASPLTADTTGELCNMIAGSWKSRQPCDAAACALSTPRITPQQLACPASDTQSFRHSLVRTYRFQEHCLRLELAFD